MQLIQTATFRKIYKKLHTNQLAAVNKAIQTVIENPEIGEKKKGDLAWLWVYKFKVLGQLTLLGYAFDGGKIILTLVYMGSHENFYRDLKN